MTLEVKEKLVMQVPPWSGWCKVKLSTLNYTSCFPSLEMVVSAGAVCLLH